MNSLEDMENEYKDACNRLYTAAQEASNAKEDNLLSLDVHFPGVSKDTSSRLAHEVNDYLQALSDTSINQAENAL